MSWQVEDADANRQGLTIAEFGEAGGPGMGGCPAGPTRAERAAARRGLRGPLGRQDQAAGQLDPGHPGAGCGRGTGYSVEAIAATKGAGGEQTGILVRAPATATAATISGLDATENYSVEVRSITGTKLSDAVHGRQRAGPRHGHRHRRAAPRTPSYLRATAGGTSAVTPTRRRGRQRRRDLLHDRRVRPARRRPPVGHRHPLHAPIPITAPNTTLRLRRLQGRRATSATPAPPGRSSRAPRPCPAPHSVTVAGQGRAATRQVGRRDGRDEVRRSTATPATTAGQPRRHAEAAQTTGRRRSMSSRWSRDGYNVTVAAANASGTGRPRRDPGDAHRQHGRRG